MIARKLILVAAAICGFIALLTVNGVDARAVPPDSEWAEAPVTADSADQVLPSISGDNVAWMDYRNTSTGCPSAQNCTSADIFTKDLSTGIEQRLTVTPNGLDPDISGNLVVWRNWDTGKIVVHNLANGAEQIASTAATQMVSPSVSGNLVVWIDYRNSTNYGDVYMRDLTQAADGFVSRGSDQPAGTPDPKLDKRNPDIDGDIVVWEDMRNAFQDTQGWWHNPDIYFKNLATGAEGPVCTNLADQYNPSVSGHKVFWQDYRNGNWDIYEKDLDTGVETRLTTNLAEQSWPTASGDYIVWKDKREGDEDIYFEDLAGVVSGGIQQRINNDPVLAPLAVQKIPVISGLRLAWMDNRAGNWDIYETHDGVAPLAGPVEPQGIIKTNSTTVTTRYSDGIGIDHGRVTVAIDGALQTGCLVRDTQVDCQVGNLAEGMHSVDYAVADLAGNVTAGSSTFTVDTLLPAVNDVVPSGWVSGAAAILTAGFLDGGTGIDTNSIQALLDGSPLTGCTVQPDYIACPAYALTQGSHTFTVSVSDQAGNTGSGGATFSVDTVGPVVGPVSLTVTAGTDSAAVEADLGDPAPGSGIDPDSIAILLDGVPVADCLKGESHVSCQLSGLSLGGHSISITASDANGNQGSASKTFQLADSMEPVITAPGPVGSVVVSSPGVGASYSDAYPSSGIDTGSVTLTIDGGAVPGCAVTPLNVVCHPGELAEGNHLVSVSVSDSSGNTATHEWSFCINGGPLVSGLQPAAGAVVNNVTPEISGNWTSNNAAIDAASVRVYIDGAEMTAPEVAFTEGSFSFQPELGARLGDGTHSVRTVVADVNKRVTDQTWSFTVTSPSISIAPAGVHWASYADYFNRELTVNYRISDIGSGNGSGVKLELAMASSGVILEESLPLLLGDFAVGEAKSFSFRYRVPAGVMDFLVYNVASFRDDGGNVLWWPGPLPVPGP